MPASQPVGLAAFLDGLRHELTLSMANAKRDAALSFELTELQVELQVTAETAGDGSGKIKFWVVEAGGGAKSGNKTVQAIKMSLQPIMDGKSVNPRVTTNLVKRPSE
jgi:hypothetical protein